MGSKLKDMYEIGYLFLALDPSKIQNSDEFKNQNQQLINELLASATTESVIPGQRSRALFKENTSYGKVTIPNSVFQRLKNAA